LEHEAAKLFMRHYERLHGQEIRHIWHNKPNKPDVSCELEGLRLDLEIAHLYGSEAEAMAILKRDLTDKTREALREQANCSNVHERLLSALNRILMNKAQKHYKSQRVWLIIRNAHPAWTSEEIIALRDKIHVPEGHPFEQIWIVADYQAQSGIVQLFPSIHKNYC
ncbi:hypothetical protein A3752_24575, partial [Oleiphilus sp. HI0081]